MDFTFGITTGGRDIPSLVEVVNSIHALNIPRYEILVIGGHFRPTGCEHIEFRDRSKTHFKPWITKKKNILCQKAQYENIVLLHDYIVFEQDWYKGFLLFGNDFKVCMTKINNADGSRFRDWVLLGGFGPQLGLQQRNLLLPYYISGLTKYMYIPGSYWVAKKDVMLEIPLDERLKWGENEDIEWSTRVKEKYRFSMNRLSTVKSLKQKQLSAHYPNRQELQIIEQLDENLKRELPYIF